MSADRMSLEAIPSAVWLPFHQWRLAFAALRKAEAQRKSHAELIWLSSEVIRTRNILIAARLADGFTLPAEVVRQAEADAELLTHPDDTAALIGSTGNPHLGRAVLGRRQLDVVLERERIALDVSDTTVRSVVSAALSP
jgi:hypothetical protein